MTATTYTLADLFEQLGLPNDARAIDDFIRRAAPLPADVPLDQASCWTPAQADFLRQAVMEDAEWAEAVEELNALLHKKGSKRE